MYGSVISVKCPRCSGRHLQPVSETITTTRTKTGGYSGLLAGLGWLFFGPLGTLLGTATSRDYIYISEERRLYWVCSDCGCRFRNIDDWDRTLSEKEALQKKDTWLALLLIVLGMLLWFSMSGLSVLGIVIVIGSFGAGIKNCLEGIKLKNERKRYMELYSALAR